MGAIVDELDAMVAKLDLSPEQRVYLAAARYLAEALDAAAVPNYAVSRTVAELRNCVAALTGAPTGRGVDPADLDRILGR
jgi:hypothetical protein